MDAGLRMKDKLVQTFEHALDGRHAASAVVARLEREIFHIRERTYIMNTQESIRRNIAILLRQGMRGR